MNREVRMLAGTASSTRRAAGRLAPGAQHVDLVDLGHRRGHRAAAAAATVARRSAASSRPW